MISHPAAAEAGLQCVSMVVLGWIGCSLSGGCATLWMIRMFTWGRRAATACAGNHSTSARYPVARERERGVRAFKAVVVFHASRRRVLAQRGIPTAHYSHLSLSESWFFVLSDRSTRARSRSRYGRTDGLGVTRAAKQLILLWRAWCVGCVFWQRSHTRGRVLARGDQARSTHRAKTKIQSELQAGSKPGVLHTPASAS
jgi:hypothetical protein